MAITGIHGLIYTSEPDAVRAVFRDVFGIPRRWARRRAGSTSMPATGWLIFKLPPAGSLASTRPNTSFVATSASSESA